MKIAKSAKTKQVLDYLVKNNLALEDGYESDLDLKKELRKNGIPSLYELLLMVSNK